MPEARPLISPLQRSDVRLVETVGAFLLLAFADLLKALAGIDRFCRLLGRLRVRRRTPPEPGAADHIVAVFEAAATHYPRRDLALALPAATVCRLRLAGAPAELVVGLSLFPLRARTWVEVDGNRLGRAPLAREPVRIVARY